ncbi:hypothetical protein F511_20097 [Dorcoceras hygrometricum]|uniref:Uncharacterized protein n=1 Tax=Dorcoceras hygrometricum TaxID=472368 RepID=A0A2Z7CKD4_9LAMI|nr:hypothetical protein F511_20097 [Dorcoceras hygrometricum]
MRPTVAHPAGIGRPFVAQPCAKQQHPVGHHARPARMAPGSDQFHKETGTSKGRPAVDRLIMSTTGNMIPPSICTRRSDGFLHDRILLVKTIGTSPITAAAGHGGGAHDGVGGGVRLAHRIMVKRLATSPNDPLGITDSACKNQLVVVSVQYGPFNTYIPIRSTTIGKSRVAKDPITMHTSWRSNSDIASVTRRSDQTKRFAKIVQQQREFLIHLLVCIVDWILVATEYYTNEIKLRLLVVRLSSISRETLLIPQRTVDTLYLLIEEAGFEAEEGISGEQPRVARGNCLDDGQQQEE